MGLQSRISQNPLKKFAHILAYYSTKLYNDMKKRRLEFQLT